MAWVEERVHDKPPCPHRTRPEACMSDRGRLWECDDCGARFRVLTVDYGHDVMPGEAQVGAYWYREAKHGRRT